MLFFLFLFFLAGSYPVSFDSHVTLKTRETIFTLRGGRNKTIKIKAELPCLLSFAFLADVPSGFFCFVFYYTDVFLPTMSEQIPQMTFRSNNDTCGDTGAVLPPSGQTAEKHLRQVNKLAAHFSFAPARMLQSYGA